MAHTVDIRDLSWQIRAECPGVPEALMYMHLHRAIKTHLRFSKGWQESLDPALDWALADDFPDMSTDTPANTEVVQPTSVKWESDGNIIVFKTRDQLDELDPDWEQLTGSKPRYYTITAPGEWYLYPQNTAEQLASVRVRVALTPETPTSTSAGRTQMPGEITEEFCDHWINGALARLLKIPGKDWTNPGAAAFYVREFEQNMMDAKSRAAADFGRPRRETEYGGIPMGGVVEGNIAGDYANFIRRS